MQNERIFFAPSLATVMQQLLLYRATGVLTIWPVVGSRQEDTQITVELGRPVHIIRGLHRENASESILTWLNTWGEIHFSFLPTQLRLQLPPPSQPPRTEVPTPPPLLEPSIKPIRPPQRRTVSQPPQAQSGPTQTHTANMATIKTGQQELSPSTEPLGRIHELPVTRELPELRHQEENRPGAAHSNSDNAMTHETIVAFLTPHGKNYPVASLPRYDRTIFLLINGRRTVVDLSQLTKRPLEEVYSTLYRLQNLRLITVESRARRF